ncbi:hypothetical protein Pmani_019730 [Petrolisthes manimaculis]|uniref:TLC domain-containing protein n=1 Tax=Petrolisthes manimaculis TaxID=1843537 RepID=A0AAE1PJT6_9EUCA|nr:hypothetical protein Pmani_019730 [Petrolisthes manimaculis]
MTEVKEFLSEVMESTLPHFLTKNSSVGQWLEQMSVIVWSEDFWLPEGVRWQDLKDTEDLHFPKFYDVWIYPILLALVFLMIQYHWFEPRVLMPLARSAGLRSRPPPPESRPVLENLYRHHKMRPPPAALEKAARIANMELKEAEQWLWTHHKSNRLTKFDLFVNCGSCFAYHFTFCIVGGVIMYRKPWTWNTALCWQDYPFHNLDNDVWWYYILVLAFYYSMLITETLMPRRMNDGRIKMLLHHLTTVFLMSFSWVCNFVRGGTLVLLVHELADVLLMVAKMCYYAKKMFFANIIFGVFLLVWVITRCGFYPFWVMRSVFFEATTYMFMPSAYVFMGLLTGLLILNLAWTILIFRTFLTSICERKELKELHPDSDVEDTDEEMKKTE